MSVDQLKRLRKALVPYGLKLLSEEWQGWHAQYRIRCRRGHEVSRSGAHLLYHLVTCPSCRELKSEVVYGELRREVEGGGGFS